MELERKGKDQQPMIKSIFVQDIYQEEPRIEESYEYIICMTSKFIKSKTICEIQIPYKLNIGENLNVDNKCLRIKDFAINSNGSITYYVEDEVIKYTEEIPEWITKVCEDLNKSINNYKECNNDLCELMDEQRKLICYKNDVKNMIAKFWWSRKTKRNYKKLILELQSLDVDD